MATRKEDETRGYRSYLKPGQVIERTVPPPDTVALANLQPERKRALWAWMQANDPATAEYLQGLKTNPDVADLEAAFGPVRPVVTVDYLRRAIG